MDRHRLCRTLRGRVTGTNRLAATFYSTFPVRPASRSTLYLTLGQIQSEAETFLHQANDSGIAGTSGGANQDITVRGWIKSVRRQKNVAFLNLSDGTESNLRKGFQVVIEEPPLLEAIKSGAFSTGASVRAVGRLTESKGKDQKYDVVARELVLLGASDPENYPIQKGHMTVDYLRDKAHFRPRTNDFASMLRVRDHAARLLRSWYRDHGFTEVHTPIITDNDCEGAGEAFQVAVDTTSSTHSAPSNQTQPEKPPSSQLSEHFFGTPAYLTVSSQLHLEALASSLSRVYTLQPAFRAEGSHTSRHLSEFWMFEAEIAFVEDLDVLMDVVEDSLKNLLTNIRICPDDASPQFQANGDGGHLPVWLQKPYRRPWKRITYTDAIEILNKGFRKSRERLTWGDPLTINDERHLSSEWSGGVPIFVTDYPMAQKPFYMRTNESEEQGKTVACFDLLVPGIGELVGGSLREEREAELRAAIKRCELDEAKYEWYLDLRRYGTAPRGGFGLGFERLISWLGGWANVRECIVAPRWKGRMVL